jgi:hypothetical protein
LHSSPGPASVILPWVVRRDGCELREPVPRQIVMAVDRIPCRHEPSAVDRCLPESGGRAICRLSGGGVLLVVRGLRVGRAVAAEVRCQWGDPHTAVGVQPGAGTWCREAEGQGIGGKDDRPAQLRGPVVRHRRVVVEMGGIEPPSRNFRREYPTSVVEDLLSLAGRPSTASRAN